MATLAPPRPRLASPLAGWLAAAACAAVAIGALAWALTSQNSGPASARVPRLVGLRAAAATVALRRRGFGAVVERRVAPAAPGTVIAQVPGTAATLSKGAQVALAVAVAPPSIRVPSIVGLRLSGASRVLTTAGLQAQPEIVASSRRAGTVLSETPRPGARVARRTRVVFTVSRGPRLVLVPALRALPAAQAEAKLRGAGLVPVVHRTLSPEKPGTVIAQTPPRQQKVAPGTKVTINVATTAKPKKKTK